MVGTTAAVAGALVVATLLSSSANAVRWAYPDAVANALQTVGPYLVANAKTGRAEAMYNVAEISNPALAAALANTDPEQAELAASVVDTVATALAAAVRATTLVSEYHFDNGGTWIPHRNEPPLPMWPVNVTPANTNATAAHPYHIELILDSAQGIYPMARLLNAIAHKPAANRSTAEWDFVTVASRFVAQDSVMRWVFGPGVFSVHAWDCGGSVVPMNHSVFIDRLRARSFGPGPSYCNIVRDVDMWIITSALELVAAFDADPDVVWFWADDAVKLRDYAQRGAALILSRMHSDTPMALNGRGFAFDLGEWNDHPDWSYAGYDGAAFPRGPPVPTTNTTWDVSHGMRFVSVFDSLDRLRNITALPPPANSPTYFRSKLAVQLTESVWNRNCSAPLFTNYFTFDGWFRVGYHGKGFGYGPGDDANEAILDGGFLALAQVSEDVSTMAQCLDQVFAAMPNTPAAAFRDAHFYTHWSGYEHSPSTWKAGLDLDLRTFTYYGCRVLAD